MDETGIDKCICREKARAARSEKAYDRISGKKYKRTNIDAAKHLDKIIAPVEYEGSTCHIIFEWWFVNMLLPLSTAGMFIIMGNASFHRKEVLKELEKEAGVTVIFLPAYPPGYNLIENYWVCQSEKSIKGFRTLSDALTTCFKVE